ncbi:ethanolamine ammonia-lyase subunit EutC [Saccharospirillum mangrovi]|uniref:ethanolamine ammonia-lyase subunit EutC n=1 Tax=Saccharospirillum mangrovi TaxID=2161747 RepID=UPI000D3D38D4|nr:ethanolamine ammonia-lyase subunit EutC [Saccharospirillum mangrovi]
MSDSPKTVQENRWQRLREYTDARIGLGRSGVSLPTRHHLDFQLAHAAARDAVKRPIDWSGVDALAEQNSLPMLALHSQALDRNHYLQRPDLGRKLDQESAAALMRWRENNAAPKVVIVIADGLSSTAIENQAPKMVQQLLPDLARLGLACELLCRVDQGRVAIGDDIAEHIGADHIVLLVGERPGLSSPDSLGIYYTYHAQLGSSDADRNCLSNIRPAGLSFAEASRRLCWLVREATALGYSGVKLKDDSSSDILDAPTHQNFLVPPSNE